MPETPPKYDTNSKTLVFDVNEFLFDTVEQQNGYAVVVRFQVGEPSIKPGDMLVVLSNTDIHFHGMIASVDDGWGTASDRRDSLLPAGTVHYSDIH